MAMADVLCVSQRMALADHLRQCDKEEPRFFDIVDHFLVRGYARRDAAEFALRFYSTVSHKPYSGLRDSQ